MNNLLAFYTKNDFDRFLHGYRKLQEQFNDLCRVMPDEVYAELHPYGLHVQDNLTFLLMTLEQMRRHAKD